jgi:hypothetical protein
MTKLPNATRSLALVVAMVASLTTATAAEHGVNKIYVTSTARS